MQKVFPKREMYPNISLRGAVELEPLPVEKRSSDAPGCFSFVRVSSTAPPKQFNSRLKIFNII